MPPCPAHALWWQTRASGLVLRWELQLGAYSGFFFSFPSQLCCPLRFQNSPKTHPWEGFLLCGNFSSFTTPSPGQVSSLTFWSLLLSFIFCPTSFQREWAAFLGAGVLRQRSEVVLCKLLSIQMVFWWICGGESGLRILFLCHLRTASTSEFLFIPQISDQVLLLSVAFLTSHTKNEWK